jgi:hypothetical protein
MKPAILLICCQYARPETSSGNTGDRSGTSNTKPAKY